MVLPRFLKMKKLRQRAVFAVCAVLCGLIIIINLGVLDQFTLCNNPLAAKDTSRTLGEIRRNSIEGDRYYIGRKRLNKSNYTSETLASGGIVHDGEVASNAWIDDSRDIIGLRKAMERIKRHQVDVDEGSEDYKVEKLQHDPQHKTSREMEEEKRSNLSSWEKFHEGISQYELYAENDPAIDQLLHDLATIPIVDSEQLSGGTQIKLIMTLDDNGQALMKPMRWPREQETLPDHYYFSDYERHTAEIAAFHLDRILNFRRAPPVTGRIFNITHDIKRFADKSFYRTFFWSPSKNLCFYGACSYYCDTNHAICGKPGVKLEGSMAAFLPPEQLAPRKTWRHPYRRSYSKHKKAKWETNSNYCEEKVKTKAPYNKGRRLLDLMDMALYDFLTGNLDRHHYETFQDFENDTIPIHLDHGRAFGHSHNDDLTCLAPITQCCLMRYSTLKQLIKFDVGPKKLSQYMREALDKDQLPTVLLDTHLVALDRRLKIIIRTVHICVKERGYNKVIIDDGF